MPFQPLQCYHYLYLTYHSHLKREILRTSLPRPRKTLYHFDLIQTAFPCVIRPCPSYINLDTPCSTSLYCILSIILCFSSHFISFAPISLDLLFSTSDCVYKPPHSLTYHYLISIELDITPFTPFITSYI